MKVPKTKVGGVKGKWLRLLSRKLDQSDFIRLVDLWFENQFIRKHQPDYWRMRLPRTFINTKTGERRPIIIQVSIEKVE